MLIADPVLVAAKNYLRTDIQSAITNTIQESNAVQTLLAQLTNVTAGSAVGEDVRLIGECQNVLQSLSRTISQLQKCLTMVDRLSVMVEVHE